MTIPRLRASTDDSGFTLVELLVYSLLSVVVLGIVASLVIAGIRGQTAVGIFTSGTNNVQSVSNVIGTDVRRASYIRVATIGDDNMVTLRVKPSAESTTYSCVSYYWSKSRKEVRSKTSSAAIAAPTASTITSWNLVASKISQTGTSAVISGDGTTNSAYVNLTFTIVADTKSDARTTVKTYPRTPMSTDATPCF